MPQEYLARQFLPSASNVRRVLALPFSSQYDYNTQFGLHTLTELLNLFSFQSQPCIQLFRMSTGLEAAKMTRYVLTRGDLIDCDPSSRYEAMISMYNLATRICRETLSIQSFFFPCTPTLRSNDA
ncbi:hypothetical protein K503DRAFT_774998, partial [Rhizopogon vinicolor AM-OR11-026]